MGNIFMIAALVLFFFAAVGVSFIPNPTAWGLVAMTAGFIAGGGWPAWFKKA